MVAMCRTLHNVVSDFVLYVRLFVKKTNIQLYNKCKDRDRQTVKTPSEHKSCATLIQASPRLYHRYQLRSSQSNQVGLIVPPVKLSTYVSHSFAVAGPTICNSLPDNLRDPEVSTDNFRRQLQTFLFAQY